MTTRFQSAVCCGIVLVAAALTGCSYLPESKKIDYGTAAMVGDDVAIDLEVEFNRPNPNKK